MTSQARSDLDERLTDIDQLFQAHTALTKFKKAEAAVSRAGGGLAKLTDVVNESSPECCVIPHLQVFSVQRA